MNHDALRALARKYQALVALRARRDAGGAAPDRDGARQLRELAREFPGCLRELDTLGLAELERRAARVTAAALDDGAREPWMPWISSYHGLMRAALAIRRRMGRGATAQGAGETRQAAAAGDPTDVSDFTDLADFTNLAAEASRIAGVALDVGFVGAVRSPPQGRIGIVVLRRLEAQYQQPARIIATALFPLRRPSPYEL